MQKLKKSLVIKRQVDNTLNITDKNGGKKQKKLQTFDFRDFNGRRYFDNDGSQNYLVFQPIYNFFIRSTGDTETIIALESRGFSGEIIKPLTLSELK